jgi:hypothetical protein
MTSAHQASDLHGFFDTRIMDFAAKLNSPSVRDQVAAVIFLRSEGARGVMHLSLLLQKCQAIEPSKELDRYEEALLGLGAITLGALIAESGVNHADPLHDAAVCWLLELTKATNISVAGHSVYALVSLCAESSVARERLCDIAISDLRGDEHEHVSLRAVALRLLRRIDPSLAATFVDAPAFEEYLHAVKYWTATDVSKNAAASVELQSELDWFMEIKNRRNAP